MRVQDVYKLLYQGVFGPKHSLGLNVREALLEEIAQLGHTSSHVTGEEETIERVSPDGLVIRVNLRPLLVYNRAEIDDELYERKLDALVECLIISAESTRGSLEEFLQMWSDFKMLAVSYPKWGFGVREIEEFEASVKAKDYPPVHHSDVYVELYKPAYRVMLAGVFNGIYSEVGLSYLEEELRGISRSLKELENFADEVEEEIKRFSRK